MTFRFTLSLRRASIGWLPLAALFAIAATPLSAQATHPHALWRVVHDLCVPDRRLTGLPAPCLEVNLAAGYAIVPDPKEMAHLLVVPTRRITGIEDPRILSSGTPNYWRTAWAARRTLAARIGAVLPRETVGLAINAVSSRSQNQLHIHVSCIQPALADVLRTLEPRINEHWSSHEVGGGHWRIRTIVGEDLGDANPFRLVADSSPAAAANMGRQTVIVVGAQLKAGAGFYILTHDAETDDHASAESLLDERCEAIPHRVPPS